MLQLLTTTVLNPKNEVMLVYRLSRALGKLNSTLPLGQPTTKNWEIKTSCVNYRWSLKNNDPDEAALLFRASLIVVHGTHSLR